MEINKENKQVEEVITFPVPLEMEEITNIKTIKTNPLSELSNEQIINKAIKLHLQGNVKDAGQYYQYLIRSGFKDHRVFANYGLLLKDIGKLKKAEICQRRAIEIKPNFAEAYSNLAAILNNTGKLSEAVLLLKKAIKLKPDFAEAHYNLGNVLLNLSRLEEAEFSTRKAIKLNPNFADSYSTLGNILNDLGKLKEAEICYSYAIKLNPRSKNALLNRGQLLFKNKELNKALIDADQCNSEESRVFALEILYALGRIDEIYRRIEEMPEQFVNNIRLAAFSSFISEHENINTSKNFCRNPFNFLHFSNMQSTRKDYIVFIDEIIKELSLINKVWEPRQNTTVNGFHTPMDINLFSNPSKNISKLKTFILKEIDQYYLKYAKEDCIYISKWPSKKELYGWHVVLKKQGYQEAHFHPDGWLSGVIYLKVVPSREKNEGAIEFTLDGYNYSHINSPKLTYQPKLGDIVLFPSSLYHRTIPFTTDQDRMVIAFDLMPYLFKSNLE